MTGRLDSSRFYRGQVAQSEERPPEKRKVGGSIPPLSTTCRNVRHGLPMTQVHCMITLVDHDLGANLRRAAGGDPLSSGKSQLQGDTVVAGFDHSCIACSHGSKRSPTVWTRPNPA